MSKDTRIEGYALEIALVREDPEQGMADVLAECERRDPDLLDEVISHAVAMGRVILGGARMHPDSEGAPAARATVEAWMRAWRRNPRWEQSARAANALMTERLRERAEARAL